jgi:hypothetical protein
MRKALAAVGALIVVPGGAYLVSANMPTGGKVAISVGVAWWLVTSALLDRFALRGVPDLRTPVRATLAVATVASLVAAFVVTRGNTVDEDIVAAAPVRRAEGGGQRAEAPARNVQVLAGTFKGESGHRGEGKAAVVELAKGGRVVTFSSFDVDPGAGDLHVYLHEGRTTSDDLGEFVEIAELKGNKGDQQYEIPSKVNLERYDTVVIWCVPFSTRIAQAPLS